MERNMDVMGNDRNVKTNPQRGEVGDMYMYIVG